jgi:hypothetical protein
MPPAPTDLLAEDVRELRESQQRLAARMDSQSAAFRDMSEEFIKFRSRINTILAILSAVAAVVLSSAGMLWSGSASLQRELGRTEAIVSGLDKRFDDLRALGDKLNRVSEDLSRLQGRLDHENSTPPRKSE